MPSPGSAAPSWRSRGGSRWATAARSGWSRSSTRSSDSAFPPAMTEMADDILRNPLALFDVSGKVTVITGASGALGRAAAIALGAVGARLLLASGSADGLESVAAAVREVGGEAAVLARRPDTEADAADIMASAVDA